MKRRVIAGNSLKQVLKQGQLCEKNPVRSSFFLRWKSSWLKFLALHCKLNRGVMLIISQVNFLEETRVDECKAGVCSTQHFGVWIVDSPLVCSGLAVSQGHKPLVLPCPLLGCHWVNRTSWRELVEAKAYFKKLKLNSKWKARALTAKSWFWGVTPKNGE